MSQRIPPPSRCLRTLLVAAGILFAGGQWACTDYTTYRNGEAPGPATLAVHMTVLDTPASALDTSASRVVFTSRWKIDRTDFMRRAYMLQLEERTYPGSLRVQHLLASPDDSVVDTLRCHPSRLRGDLLTDLGDSAWMVVATSSPGWNLP